MHTYTKAGSLEVAAVVVYRYSQWVPQHVLGRFGRLICILRGVPEVRGFPQALCLGLDPTTRPPRIEIRAGEAPPP